MLVPIDNKDIMLTLDKQEWLNFKKELANPKPTSKELKKLMSLEGFGT